MAIYLDNHSTTRVDPRVLETMLPYFSEHYGNAASRTHRFGQTARSAVDDAREQVAALIGAHAREVVFTSGATESNNLALKGVVGLYRKQGDHLVTVTTEHRSVLDPCRRLEQDGIRVTYLPVDRYGQVTVEQVAAALTDRTLLVSVMAANNEIGTLQPIRDIGRLCKERRVLFHTDAVQAAGKIPLDVEEMGIDLLSLSAHKLYGPKGVGALYVRRSQPRVRVEPLLHGGGHEGGMRSGTLPVPNIVGFGAACAFAQSDMAAESERLLDLRERLRCGIMEALDGVFLNGHPTERLAGNLNLSFASVDGGALMMRLRDIAVSSGSACTSAEPEPSYVLRALGVSDELAHGSLRFGLGRFTTKVEIDAVSEQVVHHVQQLRALQPIYQMEKSAGSL